MYIKPPDELTLADVLPDDHIWTEGTPEFDPIFCVSSFEHLPNITLAGLGGPKDVYLSDCCKLRTSTDMLYILHKHLVEKLLDNTDHTNRSPSSRKIFNAKLRQYVMENSVEHRVSYSINQWLDH